jgi:hypothetical protein
VQSTDRFDGCDLSDTLARVDAWLIRSALDRDAVTAKRRDGCDREGLYNYRPL